MSEKFEPTGFSAEIFKSRYAFTEDETWEEACKRVAKQVAIVEIPDKVKKYEDKFYDVLITNRFVPGGRIWYGSGRPNPQLLNCFVLNSDLDSKEGWGNISREMIITSMAGGGCGIDFSDVRPRGSNIKGHRGTCPGSVELMKLLNGNGKPVKAGGHRRVAQMFSLDLNHPDIIEFLDSKLKNGELDLANISVKCKNTSKFIEAVKNNGDWELSWKGQYKKTIKAKYLWDIIVKNAYNSAEPGFLNWELALSENNIYYIEDLVTANPCGEIVMSSYDACDLGHLVLPRFIIDGDVDWHLLASTIRTSVRFLDNIIDISKFPLPEMKDKTNKLRRIGLGTTGLADTLVLLGYKYGSKEGNEFIDKLYRFISKIAYESSVMLAIEKGPFPLCNPEQHIKSGYIKRMTKKVKDLILEHGIRNCALLTQAPTGTVSILSGNCSSGIEPIFAPAYERRYWENDNRKMELVFHPIFAKFMKEKKDISSFIFAKDLSVKDHMEVQKIIQKHIDNAVSKTINIPEKYSIKDMSNIWLEYLPFLKGATFFRENSRDYIDENGNLQEPPLKAVSISEAKKRFKDNYKETNIIDCNTGACEL